ncbi:MAG TPA: ABC transporter ATP-binding protein [Candidatus Cloacimonadota bacterium]|jgi:putative ABC transport system ATP-binding protein|nr:ABC transporter ATP-binding protein [Candidatus Cloacimonadota bacterium]
MLRTKDLCKIFQTDTIETTALKRVNIEILQGEFVAIVGPSGCGKTSLLNMIGLLDQPTDGDIYFMGQEVSRLSEFKRTIIRKENIGFIFQSFNLIDELTVFENVELPYFYTKMAPAERKKKVDDVLEKLQLSHRRNHFPQQLSGGQQQRVAVARAVVSNPKLILADEPTGNLDSKNGEEVMELLKQLNQQGTTIVMVTHSQVHALYAQREIHLLDGQVIKGSISDQL